MSDQNSAPYMSRTSSSSNYRMSLPPTNRSASFDNISAISSINNSSLTLPLNDQFSRVSAPESVYNLDTVYKNNTRFATQSVLPPDDYHSPYYIPFKNIDDPRPVDQLIYRFSIWKMIIKQVIFYFKEMSVFKSQTYQGNRAMLENLEILKRQNSGKLKVKANANKSVKKSLSSSNFAELQQQQQQQQGLHSPNDSTSVLGVEAGTMDNNFAENDMLNLDQQNIVNKLLQTTFLPPHDNSILSISSTFFNNHNYLKEKELLTYQHLTNRLIPRLENLKDQLNETIKQMSSIKNSPDYKTKNLKMEIAKTGGILSDYITSIELLKTGHSKSSLGTTINLKDNKIEPKLDPYILKLKLDLQLKDQLYIEAHLKEMYYDLQYKSVQLEKILYTEIQSCISAYTDLIDSELNVIRDNLINPLKQGFAKNDPTRDWDYFIKNDRKKNFLPIDAKTTLARVKKVRKNSDIVYPYRNNVISSCIYSGYLERKSKYLKNYSKFFYVLTINFLHEFKSSDRIKDLNPIQSFSLTDVTIATIDDDPRKFVLRIYKNAIDRDNSKAKFTFKAPDIDTANKWIDYISDLTGFENTIERNLSYDVNDDDENNSENTETDEPVYVDNNKYPDEINFNGEVNIHSTEQNNFVDGSSTFSSPSSNSNHSNQGAIDAHSVISHSRSTSDELYSKKPSSQFQQVQNSLKQVQLQPQGPSSPDYFSQQQQQQQPVHSPIGNVTFKSIKSQPNMRQSSSTSLHSIATSNSRVSSRASSRNSSRAPSPASSRQPSIMSPKLTPTNVANGDYFSYTPRKVQASIIRNGNRLASTGSGTGRLTPGGNNSALSINTKTSSSSNSIPKINISQGTPVVTEKPKISVHGASPSKETILESNEERPVSSGLERRRKTLSEKLDITGLVSSNRAKHGGVMLKLGGDESIGAYATSGLPETPGIIPGSMMNQVFDTTTGDNYDDHLDADRSNLP